MQMAKQLYSSPAYIQQQKTTLDQILGSINQGDMQEPDGMEILDQADILPVVTE